MKKFENMTREEKRVAIAKDIIKQLNAKIIVASHIGYIIPRKLGKQGKIDRDVKIQEIDGEKVMCQVCMKGACILKALERQNKIKLQVSHVNGGGYSDIIEDIYTSSEWRLLEQIYENWEIGHWELEELGDWFTEEFGNEDDDHRKMKLICRYYIENKGAELTITSAIDYLNKLKNKQK